MVKAAKGLGIECSINLLELVCSNGLVPDNPIEGHPWTLGKYIQQHGGNRNRGKKVWGLHVPFEVDDDSGLCTRDSVSAISYKSRNHMHLDQPVWCVIIM